MNSQEKKRGNVVVLGVKGSGKTVFLSVLGKAFEEVQAYGLNLTALANTETRSYVGDVYDRMSRENEWPISTIEGTRKDLAWTVRCGDEDLFVMQSIDCAGEEIVKALVPSAGDKARRRKEKSQESSGAEWDSEDAEDSSDAIDLIARRIEEASIVCIFVNPADFEKYIVAKGDSFGPQREIRKALSRSHDMWYLLQTFLEDVRLDGKEIIVAVTQAGRDEFAGMLGEKGSARALLLSLNGQFKNWKGFRNAHVIAVSAVNNVVYKKRVLQKGRRREEVVSTKDISGKTVDQLVSEGIVLMEKSLDPSDPDDQNEDKEIKALEAKIMELAKNDLDTGREELELARKKSVWIGKDGAEHAKARECPWLDEADGVEPSMGLVEFLLAVGGPLCEGLRPLDKKLRYLRKCNLVLFEAKKFGDSAKNRLKAAYDLQNAWEQYKEQAESFLEKHSLRSAVEATNAHLAEEEANVIGWISAEQEIDELLRNAASTGNMPSYDGALISRIIDGTAERVARAEADRPGVMERYRKIEWDNIVVKPEWLASQFDAYYKGIRDAIRRFDEAVESGNTQVALESFADLEYWGTAAYCKDREKQVTKCKELAKIRSRHTETLKAAGQFARNIDLQAVRRIIDEKKLAEAREKVRKYLDEAEDLEEKLQALESDEDRFGDLAEVQGNLQVVRDAIGECNALDKDIEGRQTDACIANALIPVDIELRNAGASFAQAKSLFDKRDFNLAMDTVQASHGHFDVAGRLLSGLVETDLDIEDGEVTVSLSESDEFISKRRREIAEGDAACGNLLAEIDGAIARARKARRIVTLSVAVAIVSGVLVLWAKCHFILNSKLRDDWAAAVEQARMGEYEKALAIVDAIRDIPFLGIYRASVVDENLVDRIKGGDNFHYLSRAVDEKFVNLRKKEGGVLAEIKEKSADTSVAKEEWRRYEDSVKKAQDLVPAPELDEFNLPRSMDELKASIDQYMSVSQVVADADSNLDKFKEKALAAIEERERVKRLSDLRNILKGFTPVQGWSVLASALPRDGVDKWLERPDEKLSGLWGAVLSTGLPAGSKKPDFDAAKVAAAFEEIREKASEDEWSNNFAAIESDSKAVIEAARIVQDELQRRKERDKFLQSAQAALKKGAWVEADEQLGNAMAKMSDNRPIDAISRRQKDEIKDGIAEGRILEVEKCLNAGHLRDAALKVGAITDVSEKRSAQLENCWTNLVKCIKSGIATDVANGTFSSDDVGPESRFCLGVSPFLTQVVKQAVGAAIDSVCPQPSGDDPSVDFLLNANLLTTLSSCDTLSAEADVVRERLREWRDNWLEMADSLAEKSTGVSNHLDKWNCVVAAEALLKRVEDCEQMVFNNPDPTKATADLRAKLPPVLRVSLWAQDYGKALDAYSLVITPKKGNCGSISNSETGKNDLLVTNLAPGGSLRFKFNGDNPDIVRVINCAWNGSRSVVMQINVEDF